MSEIEKRARELLLSHYRDQGFKDGAALGAGDANQVAIKAIAAALTPPDGYVLVPEDILRPLLRDAITSVEFIAGRAQSKPLSRRISDRAWKLIEAFPARQAVSP